MTNLLFNSTCENQNEGGVVVQRDGICVATSTVCWHVIVCLVSTSVSVSSHWRWVVCCDHVWLCDSAPVQPRHTQTIAAGINSISASHDGKMSESHWANLQPCTWDAGARPPFRMASVGSYWTFAEMWRCSLWSPEPV